MSKKPTKTNITKVSNSNVTKFNPHLEYDKAKTELVNIYLSMGMKMETIQRIFDASERMTIAAIGKHEESKKDL